MRRQSQLAGFIGFAVVAVVLGACKSEQGSTAPSSPKPPASTPASKTPQVPTPPPALADASKDVPPTADASPAIAPPPQPMPKVIARVPPAKSHPQLPRVTGALPEPRAEHTATLMKDGRILLVGGFSKRSRKPTATTAVIGREAYSVKSAGRMAVGRVQHTATSRKDGLVLVVGGKDAKGKVVGVAELFDPKVGKWTSLGRLVTPRRLHTATLLNDGRVIIIGGLGSDGKALASTEVYDPASGKVEPGPTLRKARSSHTTTLLKNGGLMVVGGVGDKKVLTTAEYIRRLDRKWHQYWLREPVADHVVSLESDGAVLVRIGERRWRWDPGTRRWTLPSEENTEDDESWMQEEMHTYGVHPNGRVAIAGGVRTSTYSRHGLSSTNKDAIGWLHIDNGGPEYLRVSRASHTITWQGKRLVIVGGYTGPGADSATSTIEVFDTPDDAKTQSRVSVPNDYRSGAARTTLPDGRVLVSGGELSWNTSVGPGGGPLRTTEIVSKDGRLRVAGPMMHDSRSGHSITPLADGRLLFVGGSRLVEFYVPKQNRFVLAGDLGTFIGADHQAVRLKDGRVAVTAARRRTPYPRGV